MLKLSAMEVRSFVIHESDMKHIQKIIKESYRTEPVTIKVRRLHGERKTITRTLSRSTLKSY